MASCFLSVNEIIFYIGNIYLNNHDIDKLEKFLESVEIQDDYKVLINGIKLASLDNEDENSLNKYLEEIECIRNEHLKSIGLWYLAIYFNNFSAVTHSLLLNDSSPSILNN